MENLKTGQLTLGGQFDAYKRGQLERNIQTMPKKPKIPKILSGPTNSRSRKQVKKLMKLPKIVLAELVQNYEACFREVSQKH